MHTLSSPIYFLRHGQTDWNVRGLFQGRSDIPLNDTGRSQARAYAALLQGHFAATGQLPPFATIVASPLQRAQETARIVARELESAGFPMPEICPDERLMEQHYGGWEGLTLAEIRARYPDADKRLSLLHDFAADGGESMQQLRERVCSCFFGLAPHTLVVGHFGTLLGLMLELWGKDMDNFPRISQEAVYIVRDQALLQVDRQTPQGTPILLS